MSVPVLPMLNETGWAISVADRLDGAFSDFITTNYSQSELWYGKLASLPYLIKENSADLLSLRSKAESTLRSHLENLFEKGEIAVCTKTDPLADTKIGLVFSIVAVENGEAFNFVKTIENINSKLKLIMELNNG